MDFSDRIWCVTILVIMVCALVRQEAVVICEGKRARVTYCKQAETLAPIPACMKSPLPIEVYDGEENIHKAKDASVTCVELVSQEKAANVRWIEPMMSSVSRLEGRKTEPARVSCKAANSDITLDRLFRKQYF